MNAPDQAVFAADAADLIRGNPSPIFDDFKEAMAEAEPMKVFIPEYEFNDDDVYVYVPATKKLVRHCSVNSYEVFCARYRGITMLEGQAWAKGRNAKTLSLWRAA